MDRVEHVDDMSQEAWGRWFARRGRLDIALLLFTVWDPVGVSDVPEAYDEYDSYAPQCLRPIASNDALRLAATLAAIEQSSMGFSTQAVALADAAKKILSGAQASAQRWLRDELTR